ncbi:MAG: hypothetical protein MJE63_20560 [Proteobacteria bacterium]|nr:hypothetical protein [Pseudomonadota bacterium]
MSECLHKNLVLIKESSDKLRCIHCHLTITPDELNDSYCPECYEESGRKRYDFEQIEAAEQDSSQYRCEDCGALI